MVGTAIIGDSRNGDRDRPTSLTAEARSLSRLLRILKSPETAANALTVTLETYPRTEDPRELAALCCVRSQVAQVIEDVREGYWSLPDRYAEYNMAMAVESVLQEPSSFSAPESPQRQLGYIGMDDSCSISSSISTTSQIIPANSANSFYNPATELAHPWGQFNPNAPLTTAGISVAVVSDQSSVEDDDTSSTETRPRVTVTEQVQQIETRLDFNQIKIARHIWAVLLESVHLQVTSRSTRVCGEKKIYEVYRLKRPVQDISDHGQEAIVRSRMEAECRSLFKCYFSDQSHCRVYTTLLPLSEVKIARALYVQFNLGKPYDHQDETNRSTSGEKNKKHEEFIAVLVPGSPFFALTASRAPSRSRLTPSVYTILETVLTETAKTYAAAMTTINGDKGGMYQILL
jgi:hypothetical protein